MSAKPDANNRVSISWINGMALEDPKELVRRSEAAYDRQIQNAVDRVYESREECPVLLVSGPSASSKTTTANKIAAGLRARGIESAVVSLDDFFKNRDDLPILPNGETDFESIDTLHMETVQSCFDELLSTGEAMFPHFDFKRGVRENGVNPVKAGHGSVLIVEGIHALNPKITEGCTRTRSGKGGFLRLYISPNSDYEDAGRVVLTSREVRLIRRLVRDHFYRGSSVENTMKMWSGVVRSEIVNIVPYESAADIVVDSMILYEPAVWMRYLSTVLSADGVSRRYEPKLRKLRRALDRFIPIDLSLLPKDTVLREFLEPGETRRQ